MSTRRRKLVRAVYHTIPWILARGEPTSIVVWGPGMRAHFAPPTPSRPRWARWMTRGEWEKTWNEAVSTADLSRRLSRATALVELKVTIPFTGDATISIGNAVKAP